MHIIRLLNVNVLDFFLKRVLTLYRNIIIQMIELMTKNRNTKIYNFLCFKVIMAAVKERAVLPYDSFEK